MCLQFKRQCQYHCLLACFWTSLTYPHCQNLFCLSVNIYSKFEVRDFILEKQMRCMVKCTPWWVKAHAKSCVRVITHLKRRGLDSAFFHRVGKQWIIFNVSLIHYFSQEFLWRSGASFLWFILLLPAISILYVTLVLFSLKNPFAWITGTVLMWKFSAQLRKYCNNGQGVCIS